MGFSKKNFLVLDILQFLALSKIFLRSWQDLAKILLRYPWRVDPGSVKNYSQVIEIKKGMKWRRCLRKTFSLDSKKENDLRRKWRTPIERALRRLKLRGHFERVLKIKDDIFIQPMYMTVRKDKSEKCVRYQNYERKL